MSVPALRVLLVITQAELGGAQQYVLMLAKALRQRGDHVVVACGDSGELIPALQSAGITVRIVPALVRPIRPLADLRALAKLIRITHDEDFQIVHTNSTKAGIIGRVAARIAGADVVLFTVHGLVLNESLSRPQFAIYWILERIAATISNQLIAVSEADREAIVRLRIAPPTKVTVVHNGIDLCPKLPGEHVVRRDEARQRLGVTATAKVIGTIANLYPTKGLDCLIRAAARLGEAHPSIQVIIVGEGSERSRLERLIAELGLERQVQLVGRIRDCRDLLPAFDLFVLPSRKEGLPFALLEAMAEALPVVVSDAGGMPEVVEHGRSGLVVPRGDAAALACAIADILESPDVARRYGEAARQRICSAFDQDQMVRTTLQVYQDEYRQAVRNRVRRRWQVRSLLWRFAA